VVGLDFFREKHGIYFAQSPFKHLIEHATDVVLAIVYAPLCFVPEDWHRTRATPPTPPPPPQDSYE